MSNTAISKSPTSTSWAKGDEGDKGNCGGTTVGSDAFVSAGDRVEDDVPDNGVWMGGRLSAVFEGPTWE